MVCKQKVNRGPEILYSGIGIQGVFCADRQAPMPAACAGTLYSGKPSRNYKQHKYTVCGVFPSPRRQSIDKAAYTDCHKAVYLVQFDCSCQAFCSLAAFFPADKDVDLVHTRLRT